VNIISKTLYDSLRKNFALWSDKHTKIVQQIKKQVQEIPCLYIVNPLALKIVETGESELGYGDILK
jgi:hypothetical protein